MTAAEEWAGRQKEGMDAPLRGVYLDHLLERINWAMSGIAKSKEGENSPRYLELAGIHADLTAMKKEWTQWQL